MPTSTYLFEKVQYIRWIDAGQVSGIRSQTIYHALGHCRKPGVPDTIVFAKPTDAYVCIGYFQDAEEQVDLEYCARNGLAVIRREQGGGAVLVDDGQVFVQWIFDPKSLPWRVQDRFRLFAQPMIEVLRSYGLDARYVEPNDIQVEGKKIAGLGAATIGHAEIVTGNFIFHFDCGLMAQILQAPSEAFRQRFRQRVQQKMTALSMWMQRLPPWPELRQRYLGAVQRLWPRARLECGAFTEEERTVMRQLDKEMCSPSWLFHYKKKHATHRIVKVCAQHYIAQLRWPQSGSLLFEIQQERIRHPQWISDEDADSPSAIQEIVQHWDGMPVSKLAIPQTAQAIDAEFKQWLEGCIDKIRRINHTKPK